MAIFRRRASVFVFGGVHGTATETLKSGWRTHLLQLSLRIIPQVLGETASRTLKICWTITVTSFSFRNIGAWRMNYCLICPYYLMSSCKGHLVCPIMCWDKEDHMVAAQFWSANHFSVLLSPCAHLIHASSLPSLNWEVVLKFLSTMFIYALRYTVSTW